MLPEPWITRIFAEMSAMYGAKFTNMWSGQDAALVKEKWATTLSGFQDRPECIRDALDALNNCPYPPTLPEFLNLCRNSARRFGDSTLSLPHKKTPEEIERSREFSRKLSKERPDSCNDPLDTWRYPVSQKAVDELYDAKKKPWQYPIPAKIFDELVAKGIITPKGVAIMLWNKLLRKFERVAAAANEVLASNRAEFCSPCA